MPASIPSAVLGSLCACAAATAQTMPDFVAAQALPLPLDAWVWAGSPPGDPSRLFAMEGGGTIRVLDITRAPSGLPVYTLRSTPFLSITTGQARSVEFAPDYAATGKFYVAYEIGGGSRIAEFQASPADPNIANPTARVIRDFSSLGGDHALGSMHFWTDGYLYIGVGDGGSSGNGQSISSLFGKLLRIDPTGDAYPTDSTRNYRIPAGNPLITRVGAAPEIWHIGLRNPWRWSFDRWSRDLWIADVGGSHPGEIDRVPGAGAPYSNFGWSYIDGASPQGGGLNPDFTPATLITPRLSFASSGCATIGGVMYRGNDIRPWRGRFVWADTCNSGVKSAWFDGVNLMDVQDHANQLGISSNVSMVAEDGAGELYVLQASRGTISGGYIYRIVPAGPQPTISDVGQQGGFAGTDGAWDNNDFVVFVDWFFNNDPRADMGKQGGLRGVDQTLDNNDFVVFIDAFFSGN